MLPVAVDGLCLKVDWMEAGATCRNGGSQKGEAEVRVGEMNGLTEHIATVVLRDAKKAQPICNWLDGWEAEVWPGAVSPQWGQDHPGKPVLTAKNRGSRGGSCKSAPTDDPASLLVLLSLFLT